MKLVYCLLYIAALGLLSNLIGPMLPKHWFRGDRFPFKTFKWEHDGRVYLKFRIRDWKDKVPDMSKISHRVYPKKVKSNPDEENLQRLATESCLAEAVHDVLILLGLGVILIWPGIWGWIFWILYVLGNVPSIMIQRFNRPRLYKALSRLHRMQEKQK